ncbi:hypothetical protein [Sciscionella marina]|nr:hypothetical protein [Sciscionella marina]
MPRPPVRGTFAGPTAALKFSLVALTVVAMLAAVTTIGLVLA